MSSDRPGASKPTYQSLAALRDPVFAFWVDEVRAKVRRAGSLPEPLIINTLPVLYDHLAALVSGTESTYSKSTLATEHGGERARLTHLDADAVVHEYQLFRSAITCVWTKNSIAINEDAAALIHSCIDEAVRESVTGFVMMQTAFREQFFAALAHDMRTPLGTAIMALELLRKEIPDPRCQKLLATAARQHTVLNQMVQDLLDNMLMNSSEGGRLDFAAFDILPLVQGVASDAAISSGREIKVSGSPATVCWSQAAVRRALENLINNAIKYSDKDTVIEVGFELALADRALLAVSNQGPPIPADQIEAIFQLFRRADREKANRGADGWGIGLPYVRSVAERHAGSIGVESSDTTTRFYLDMPLDPRPLFQAS